MKCSEFLGRKSLHKHFCFGLLTEYMGPQGKTIFVLLQLFTPIKSYNSWGHLRNNVPDSADISSDNKLFEKHFMTSFLKPTAWWLVEYSKLWYCYWNPGRRESHAGLVFSFFLATQLGGILVPWSEIECRPSAARVWSPYHWATREFPLVLFLNWRPINGPPTSASQQTQGRIVHQGKRYRTRYKPTKPTSASFSNNDSAPHKWWPNTLRPQNSFLQ